MPTSAFISTTYRARGLERVLTELRPGSRVLDLGPPDQGNFDFFTDRGVILHIADIHRASEDNHGRRMAENQLSFNKVEAEEPFDAVLGWDVVDYLPTVALRSFDRWLADLSHADTLVYLLVSRDGGIPGKPSRFLVKEGYRVAHIPTSNQNISGFSHTTLRLNQQLVSYREEAGYLLKHGWQEHLLRRRPLNSN